MNSYNVVTKRVPANRRNGTMAQSSNLAITAEFDGSAYLLRSVFADLFEKVDVAEEGAAESIWAIRAKYPLYSDGWMSAFGANGSAGGGGVDMGVLESYAHINGRTITIGGVSIYVPTESGEGGGGELTMSDVAAYINGLGYATQQWVTDQGYLTSHQSLSSYATQQWVTDQGYLTSHQSLSSYATKSWVQSQGYLTSHQSLSSYATKSWVQSQGYLTSHQSLAAYVTTEALNNRLSSYVTTSALATALSGYLTSADLSEYLKKSEMTNYTFWGRTPVQSGTTNNYYVNGDIDVCGNITPSANNTKQVGTYANQFLSVRCQNIYNRVGDMRIEESDASGAININVGSAATIMQLTNSGATLTIGKTLTIGGATISWDATNQALKIDKPIYSEQWISAYGANGAAGMAGELTTYMWPSGRRSAINTTDIMAMTDAVYAQLQSLHLVSATDEELGAQSIEVRYSSNLTLEDAIARCVNEHGMDYGRLAVVMAKSIMQYLYQHVTYEGALTMGAPTNTLAQRIKALENAR